MLKKKLKKAVKKVKKVSKKVEKEIYCDACGAELVEKNGHLFSVNGDCNEFPQV